MEHDIKMNNSSGVNFGNGRFNEEWFWVFGYGTTAVIVIVANTMMLCSIIKNAFLHTNTHRTIAYLGTRHILRALYGLSVVYTTRWSHPSKWKYNALSSTKMGMPLVCDIMCTLDTFLMGLPMFLLVGLAVHMFTRYPSPHFTQYHPDDTQIDGAQKKKYSPHFNSSLLPREPGWLACLLPILPIIMSGLVATPIPLLHLTHKLQAIPDKQICMDTKPHLTFDISVFILAFCLPFLLIFFLCLGLFVRRCVHCSSHHCCNSWCKEEFVVVVQFLLSTVTYGAMYLPLVKELANKMHFEFWLLNLILEWVKPEIARAAEVASGLTLPLLCYLSMPTYRQFCTEPDPDDLKLSTPKAKHHSEHEDAAVLTSVRPKSLDSQNEIMTTTDASMDQDSNNV